jgi:hypothetical protein
MITMIIVFLLFLLQLTLLHSQALPPPNVNNVSNNNISSIGPSYSSGGNWTNHSSQGFGDNPTSYSSHNSEGNRTNHPTGNWSDHYHNGSAIVPTPGPTTPFGGPASPSPVSLSPNTTFYPSSSFFENGANYSAYNNFSTSYIRQQINEIMSIDPYYPLSEFHIVRSGPVDHGVTLLEGTKYIYNVSLSRPPSGIKYERLKALYVLSRTFSQVLTPPGSTFNSTLCPFNRTALGSPCVCGYGNDLELSDHCITVAIMYCNQHPCDSGCSSIVPTTNSTGSSVNSPVSPLSVGSSSGTGSNGTGNSGSSPSPSGIDEGRMGDFHFSPIICGSSSNSTSSDNTHANHGQPGSTIIEIKNHVWPLVITPQILEFNEMNWNQPQQVEIQSIDDDAYRHEIGSRTSFIDHFTKSSESIYYASPKKLQITVVDDDIPLDELKILVSRSSIPLHEGSHSHFGSTGETGSANVGGQNNDESVSIYLSSKPAPDSTVVLQIYNLRPDRVEIIPSGPFILDEQNSSIPIQVRFKVLDDSKNQNDVEDCVVFIGAFSNLDPRLMITDHSAMITMMNHTRTNATLTNATLTNATLTNATHAHSLLNKHVVKDWRSVDFYQSRAIINVTLHIVDDDGSGLILSSSDGTPLMPAPAIQKYPEGSIQRIFIRLKSHPTHNVTVHGSFVLPTSSTGGAIGSSLDFVGPSKIIITPENWNASAQHFLVLRAVDDYILRLETITTLVVELSSADLDYHSSSSSSLSPSPSSVVPIALTPPSPAASYAKTEIRITIEDNDVPGIHLSSRNVAVVEGGPWVNYDIKLKSQPKGPLTVDIRPTVGQCVLASPAQKPSISIEMFHPCFDDMDCKDLELKNTLINQIPWGYRCISNTGIQANVPKVHFNSFNWNTTQTIKVKALDDSYSEPTLNYGIITYSITNSTDPFYLMDSLPIHGSKQQHPKNAFMRVNVTDNDLPTIHVQFSANEVDANGHSPLQVVEGGKTSSFNVSLASAPAKYVRLRLSSFSYNSAGTNPINSGTRPLRFQRKDTGQFLTQLTFTDGSYPAIVFPHVLPGEDKGQTNQFKWDIPVTIVVYGSDDKIDDVPRIKRTSFVVEQFDGDSWSGTDIKFKNYAMSKSPGSSIQHDVMVLDDDVARIDIQKLSLNSLEEGDETNTMTYKVRLSTQPKSNVRLTAVSPTGPPLTKTHLNSCTNTNITETLQHPPPQLIATPSVLDFTPQNWYQWKAIVVKASQDGGYPESSVVGGKHIGILLHSASSADSNYNGTFTHYGSCHHSLPSQVINFTSYNTTGPVCNPVKIPSIEVNITENHWGAPPKLSSAKFDETGTGLIVTFDKSTNGRGMVDCNSIFLGTVSTKTPWCLSGITQPTKLAFVAFGHSTSTKGCSWISPSKIFILLGRDSTLRPGDYLMLRDGVIKSTAVSRKYSSNSTVTVIAEGVVQPVARLISESGSFVSSCSAISLDASGSHGGGGRPLRYKWHVRSRSSSSLNANLTTAIRKAKASRLHLKSSYFQGGHTYTFIVSVYSEWHTKYHSNATVSVKIASGAVPRVGIVGGEDMTLSLDNLRGDYLHIKGHWSVEQCPGAPSKTKFDPPSWHVISVVGTSPNTLIIPCTTTAYDLTQIACTSSSSTFNGYARLPYTKTRDISIPKAALKPGATYLLGLFVNIFNQISRNNSATMVLTIGRSPLIADILGAEEASIARDRAIVLDASSSKDPDHPTFTAFNYAWSCVSSYSGRPDDLCSNGTALPLSTQTEGHHKLVIPPNIFDIGVSIIFQVAVTRNDGTGRSSVKKVKRTIAAGSPPEVSIQVTGYAGRDPTTGALRFNTDSTPTFDAIVERSSGSIRYLWSIVQDDSQYAQVADPKSIWSTATYLSKVRLKANVLFPPGSYKFKLTTTDASGSIGLSTVSVLMNSPPSSGSLSIMPSSGFAFETMFTMDAAGWEDADLPLTYRFDDLGVLINGEPTQVSTLKRPSFDTFHETLIGSGSNRTVQVVVSDSLGASVNEKASFLVEKKILTSTQTEATVDSMMATLTLNIDDGATTNVLEDSSTLFAAIGVLNENKIEVDTSSISSSKEEDQKALARQNKNVTKARTALRASILEKTQAALAIFDDESFDESTSLMVLSAVAGVTSAPTESDVNLRLQSLNLTRNVLEKVKTGGVKVGQDTMNLVIGSLGNTLDDLSTAVSAETVSVEVNTSATTSNDEIKKVDENSKKVTDGIKATLNVLRDAIMIDAVAGEEPLKVVGKDLSVTVQKLPKRNNDSNIPDNTTSKISLGPAVAEGEQSAGFDIPSSALPFDDDVEVLATSFATNIYDSTKTVAGTIGLSLSKSGINMPVNNLDQGSEIIVGFPVTYTYGVLPTPAYWNGSTWSNAGLVQRNGTDLTKFISFSSSHLTDFSATTIVDPSTIVVQANTTAVNELFNEHLGGTHTITGAQSIPTEKINNVWGSPGNDVDKLETIYRVFEAVSPIAVANVVGASIQLRPDLAAQVASRAVSVAPHLAVDITLQAVNQSYSTPATAAGVKATVLSVVNMVRNTTKTIYWTTTPLATVFQAVSKHNPTLRTAMIEVVQTLSTSEQTQTTVISQAASISLPGGLATLDIPSSSMDSSIPVSVREYECGLVSTDASLIGQSCIGVAPHTFSGSVQLKYKVGSGATSCVKSTDEVSNDWRGIPKTDEKTGDGSCVILNGEAHVISTKYSVFSFRVGDSGLAFAGNLPVGPVTYSRDIVTGYLTRRESGASINSGTRALQKLPDVSYKVPNGTYENVGESTLIGFAVQPNSTQYPSSKGIFFSTGNSIRRVADIETLSETGSKGEIVVSGITTITLKGKQHQKLPVCTCTFTYTDNILPFLLSFFIIVILISGHSLGTHLKDIAMILVKGTVCSSVFYVSDKEIGCISGHPTVTSVTALTPYDVKVSTVTSGSSENVPILNWQVRLAEGYTAPIVVSVDVKHHPFHPTSIVVDHYNSLLYWSDTTERTLRRSQIDGSSIELVAKGDHIGRVLGMALTENGQSLYFTDTNSNSLMRINVTNIQADETTGMYDALALAYPREIILQKLKDPRGLAIDEIYGKIYFVELSGRIYECNIDGTNMEHNSARKPKYLELLVQRPSNVRLNSVSIDITSSRQRRKHSLYWTESNSNSIMRSNIDGRRIQQIGGLNGNLVWPNIIQYIRGGDVYFSEYLGTVKKMKPLLKITSEPNSVLIVNVQCVASDMVSQEVLAYSRVGANYRFAVND